MADELQSEVSRLEAELERIGLLMQHDRALPSATTIIAGAPISGSWWGHPKGKRIYDVLESLAGGPLALCVKLVNGKRTYIHPRLWPAFLVLVEQREEAAAEGLSALARTVFARAKESGPLRVDVLADEGLAPARALTAAAGELEDRLLLHVGSVHGDKGAHWKTLETWTSWARAAGVRSRGVSVATATSSIRHAVEELAGGSSRAPKVTLF